MQRKIFFLAILFVFSLTSNLFSQDASIEAFSKNNSGDQLKEISSADWSVYSDEENQIYYFDFENLTVNLNDIVVKDHNGNVLFRDDVFDLPVNTIYELEMKDYKAGNYLVELRSFTGVIRKKISVK